MINHPHVCNCIHCPFNTCKPIEPIYRPYIPDNTAILDHLTKIDEQLVNIEAALDLQQDNIAKLAAFVVPT